MTLMYVATEEGVTGYATIGGDVCSAVAAVARVLLSEDSVYITAYACMVEVATFATVEDPAGSLSAPHRQMVRSLKLGAGIIARVDNVG